VLLHNILLHSVDKNREQLAASCLDSTITYGELDDLTSRLCNCFINNGIKLGDRVCIYLDKSINSLISIFAILKAGAVYVPLDASAPVNRITTIINDSNPVAILSTSSKVITIVDKLPKNCMLVIFDEVSSLKYQNGVIFQWKDILEYDRSYDIPKVIETDPAYILYTSGSTGVPKGVVVSHRASYVFVEWAYNEFKLLPGEIVSNHAPLHFDLSIFDIFTTIMSGGTIVLIPPEVSLFPYNLASLIVKSKINVWYSVPSILVKMVLYGKLEQLDFSNLRLVLFAGEVFPTKYLKKLTKIIPHALFYNLYGPTETNVCTYYKVDKDNIRDRLPIGKSCPYNRLVLLNNNRIINIENDQTNFKTDVIEGELCVQGPNVMSMYWGNENNNKLEKGLYYTGDWVKRGVDGDLIYLSRLDGMIKSRGYRIEMGEIESVLHDHPDIIRSAVVPIPDVENTNLIHAFVVSNNSSPRNGEKLDEKAVKKFCSKFLPRYMVPTFITFLSELPDTHNGKVDKVRLKELASNR